MKKKTKKPTNTVTVQPVEESTRLSSLKRDPSTIIVLAIAAAAFVLALFSIHSEDFLHGAGEIFNIYGDEVVEFDKHVVGE